ncbi:MAG: [FeFe] hydrogenase H-cluster radical SAM maturase HydE [Candidatus Omnitrophota bacterium]|jgi:biotin synthase
MTKEEIVEELRREDPAELFHRADRVRREHCGDEVHLRGLIEFSNCCARGCLYCGLRKFNDGLPRYRMSSEAIVAAARDARKLGYPTVVLQSGEDPGFGVDQLCDVVSRIKKQTGCAVTLSVGERSYDDYKALRRAGADRYLLRFETSNPELFARLRPGCLFEQRVRCLDWLAELGYQVGSGCMVGLPGQTFVDMAADVLFMEGRNFDMIGIGPFIPHPETPLAGERQWPVDLVLRMVALTRIVTRNAHMPATTATGSIDPLGRQKALQCGANVIMPNVTPTQYRKYYEIYPHKICITEKPEDCGSCVSGMVLALGRKVGRGPGHTLKEKRAISS